jgi:hypothetical protein
MNAQNENLPVATSGYCVPGGALIKKIKAIAGMSSIMDSYLHGTAVASYAHALPPSRGGYGDTRYLESLLNAANLSQSLRVKQLVRWFTESGPLHIALDAKKQYRVSYQKGYDPAAFKLPAELDASPFYKVKERTGYSFDLEQSLEKVVNATQRQLKHIKDANVLDQAHTKMLNEALLQVQAVLNFAKTNKTE